MGKMANHNFKIGDRVRLKGSHYCGISSNDTGKVVSITCYIGVMWGGKLGSLLGTYPHKPEEIEHAVKVGEQLLFQFMKG